RGYSSLFSLLFFQETKIDQHRRLSEANNHLASWRHSAETATIACITKVIGGRFYDAHSFHVSNEISRGFADHKKCQSHCCRKMVSIACERHHRPARHRRNGEPRRMSILPEPSQASPSRQDAPNPAPQAADDPVSRGLRESARRMVGIAVFSGVINLLMLSGS